MKRQTIVDNRPLLKRFKRGECPIAVQQIVGIGNIYGPKLSMQFRYDIDVYGMYEALLYMLTHETEGKYEEGTTEKAFNVAIKAR